MSNYFDDGGTGWLGPDDPESCRGAKGEEQIEVEPGVFIPYRVYMMDQQIMGAHKQRMADIVRRIKDNLDNLR